MIELLKGFSDDILAVEGVGKITAADYREVMIPEAKRRIDDNETIRLLCVLGSRFDGLTPGAAWADLKLGVSRWNAFGRMAVVTDSPWIKDALALFGPIYHHPVRTFPTAQIDAARKWIVEQD